MNPKLSVSPTPSLKNQNNNDVDIFVERQVYQQNDLNRETQYERRPSISVLRRAVKKARRVSLFMCFLQTIPLLKWLPHYKWRRWFLSDIISGITVAIMHIPQGMAYGMLGAVPPISGIYMAFFPVLIYFIFGTSRHASIGTFAIVCLMTGNVVRTHSTHNVLQNGTIVAANLSTNTSTGVVITNLDVATAVTFSVAIIFFVMYFLRLGIVTSLLSETLVTSFTCACAFHIVSSQLRDLFGLPTKKRRGYFSFVLTVYDSVSCLPNAHLPSCIVTFVTCLVIILNNAYLKPFLEKFTRIPFPIELFVVVMGTTFSYYTQYNPMLQLPAVGHIPTGMPAVQIPAFHIIPNIFAECVVIAMVSYVVTMSMALTFSRKLMYNVDANQELLALGLSDLLGSFFQCLPVTASLSRSQIQFGVGGKTQIASVVSCLILLVILLWVGPVFETLPRCCLASIIVIALRNLLLQIKKISYYYKLSRWDTFVFIATFLSTLIVDLGIGLAVGICVSLMSIFIQGMTPYTCLLGQLPNTDLYLDIRRYKAVQEIPGIKIFHYSGVLTFASTQSFKKLLQKRIGFDPTYLLKQRQLAEEENRDHDAVESVLVSCVIVDFSALTFVDPAGVSYLQILQTDYTKMGISFYIASCQGPVYETLMKCKQEHLADFTLFPTVHDAVLFAKAQEDSSTKS